MRQRKIIFFLILCLSFTLLMGCSLFEIPKDTYNRPSLYEFHHVFPQEHFGNSGNGVTVKMHNYEHYRWVHQYSNFNADWKDYKESASLSDKLDAYERREAAFIAGANFISYRWLAYDFDERGVNWSKPLFAMHFDGVSNLIYNISYITSIPYKLIHFTIMCIKSIGDFGFGYSLLMFIWMIFQLAYGVVSSCIMLVLGTIIGTLWHPLQTLGNLTINIMHPIRCNIIATILELIGAFFRPIVRIFFRL